MNKYFLNMREMSYCALFLSLITAGAYIAFPIGPVPIVLQNFFILLCSLLLPPKIVFITVLSYILCGISGLPVFSGGKSGIAHIIGPTGGFLLAYIPASLSASIVNRIFHDKGIMAAVLSSIIFTVIVYGGGIFRMNQLFGLEKALYLGVLPFIIPDLIKAVFAVIIAGKISGFIKINA